MPPFFTSLLSLRPIVWRWLTLAWNPLILLVGTLFILSFSLVTFRMKRVVMDYQYHALNQEIEKTFTSGKELKAKKAQLLSVKSLSELARKYDLEHPSEQQIIVVP